MRDHSLGWDLPDHRAQRYSELAAVIGHTPLTHVRNVHVPNNNVILLKEEYKNPTGSHYDREMIRMLRRLEVIGDIRPGPRAERGTPLVETSTGNSGAAWAWACRTLGFEECVVFMPKDMPSARAAQIRSLGAEVRFSPAREYVKGLIRSFREFLAGNEDFVPTDHASDEESCVAAMEDLGREIIEGLRDPEFTALGVNGIDYFVSALGNGGSTRGIGTVLKEEFGTTLVGIEPFESPTVFQRRFPAQFASLLTDVSPTGEHGLIGTGPGDVDFRFRNMEAIEGEIAEIFPLRRSEWQPRVQQLADLEGHHVGNTSAACLEAALRLAERDEVSNQVILLLLYDPRWKYLDVREPEGSPVPIPKQRSDRAGENA